jgi:shikimate dehydrogenase
MKRFAVIGHPIAHSRSPAIHAAFAAETGIELHYEALLAPLDGFSALLAGLREQGYAGCNVTLPFKPEALAFADRSSERAQLAGAANTLGWDEQGCWADNTDGLGLVRDLQHNLGWSLTGRELLLLGAGGASSGCLGPLIEAGPATIRIWNRSSAKAEALRRRHADLAARHGVQLETLENLAGSHDAVLNGTSAALGGAGLQLPDGLLRPGGLALDMVYGAAAAPFLDWAARQQAGLRRDGLGMLVEQAAEAFERWHGRRPDTAPVLALLRSCA